MVVHFCDQIIFKSIHGLSKSKKLTLKIAYWNIAPYSSCQVLDVQIVELFLEYKQLPRYDLDIVALSNTAFWCWAVNRARSWICHQERLSTERREAGVGFAIRMQLVKLSELPLLWSDNITSFTTSAKPIYDGDKYMLRLS